MIHSSVETPYSSPGSTYTRREHEQSTSDVPTALTAPPTIWSWGSVTAPSGAVRGTVGAGSGVVSAGIGILVGAREGANVGACKGARWSITSAHALELAWVQTSEHNEGACVGA